MKSRPISTHDLDLAAARMTITGEQPSVYLQRGDSLATFDLPDDEITRQILVDYATGSLMLNVKRFAACRNFLFKKLKEVRP